MFGLVAHRLKLIHALWNGDEEAVESAFAAEAVPLLASEKVRLCQLEDKLCMPKVLCEQKHAHPGIEDYRRQRPLGFKNLEKPSAGGLSPGFYFVDFSLARA